MSDIVLVAAVGENNVIGRDNAMPWRLRSDLQRFRALTMGKPLVMGRKTFQSIGRPLPGRTNIVVSRDHEFSAPGIVLTDNLEHALAVAHGDALRRAVSEIMVIGGADIFSALLGQAARLEITHVHAEPEGAVLFPPIEPSLWRQVASERHNAGPNDEADYTVATYARLSTAPEATAGEFEAFRRALD